MLTERLNELNQIFFIADSYSQMFKTCANIFFSLTLMLQPVSVAVVLSGVSCCATSRAGTLSAAWAPAAVHSQIGVRGGGEKVEGDPPCAPATSADGGLSAPSHLRVCGTQSLKGPM